MLKAFIFDIGGVIVRTENLEPRRKWEKKLGLPDWGLANVVFNNEVSRRAQHGQATWEDVWLETQRHLTLTEADLVQLKDEFWWGDVWDTDLIGFIATLRPRFKTGVISNAPPGARENVLAHCGVETFDQLVFSYEEGLMKPAPDIYHRALARLGVAPAEAVFVDDVGENIRSAKAVGMQAIHFTAPAQARAQLQQLATQP